MAETKKHPGRPPKETKNTEHILISSELKNGLEFMRTLYKKESYGEVVFHLYQRHLFFLRCWEFIRQLTIVNKRDNESESESFNRMMKCKPRKIKLSAAPLWPDGQDLDLKMMEDFIDNVKYK